APSTPYPLSLHDALPILVANQRGHVLRAVIPVHTGRTDGGIHMVSDYEKDWHAIGVRVVDGHRSVLRSNRAVKERHNRLSFDFRSEEHTSELQSLRQLAC